MLSISMRPSNQKKFLSKVTYIRNEGNNMSLLNTTSLVEKTYLFRLQFLLIYGWIAFILQSVYWILIVLAKRSNNKELEREEQEFEHLD